MDHSINIPSEAKPLGYRHLQETFGLRALPHHVVSYIGTSNEREKIEQNGIVTIIYPKRTKVRDNWLSHLEFAIKNEGVHLQLLRELFPKIEPGILVEALGKKPNGIYLRKIWYLFEALTGQQLMVSDLTQGNYVDLLDPEHYFTSFRYLVKRQRINQNLLGDIPFCGMVRKTPALKKWISADLDRKCQEVVDRFPPSMFERAMNYLYKKETLSSFEIERETPDQKRTGEFVEVLRQAPSGNFTTKIPLVSLQNLIVDPRFSDPGYRDETGIQIFVGQAIDWKEIVHFVGPKPIDTANLMEHWSTMSSILVDTDDLHPVIAAAIVAFGFVFIHPFSDGNGRIHRFLIHHVLAKRGFAPKDTIFPVSAIMVKNPGQYDAALESFSRDLMPLIDYEIGDDRKMSVLNETIDLYRSIDYTMIAETLFEFVDQTIETELPEEFRFLENHDEARQKIREIVDLPNHQAELMIQLVLQNQGKLSKNKRKLPDFAMLTGEELDELEMAVRTAFDFE